MAESIYHQIFCSQLVPILEKEEGCDRLMASMKFSHYYYEWIF